jgi:hypothetical protein
VFFLSSLNQLVSLLTHQQLLRQLQEARCSSSSPTSSRLKLRRSHDGTASMLLTCSWPSCHAGMSFGVCSFYMASQNSSSQTPVVVHGTLVVLS